ncbi:hypothetical protein BH23PLA1_BH23PLA1_36950 [soil metagenome]
MVAELAAGAALLIVSAAEALHARRCRRLAILAFGPGRQPAPWARFAPWARVTAVGALTWGLVTLLLLPPKVHQAEALPDNERQHLLILLDVSPSMRLVDAGPEGLQSRAERVASLMASFFDRVPIEQYLISVVAFYNGAIPVVEDTKDMEVVRNIFDDLPMHYAFQVGQTDLFAGLEEATRIAQPWQPKSTILVVLSDGDTVPSTGMPKLPASIRDVLIVGVGDPQTGKFIEGRQSRQDSSTLRQVAARLGGTYHNGNEKHLSSNLLAALTLMPGKGRFEQLSRREYALIACALGASVLALLPYLLHRFGTRWAPGVPILDERATWKTGVGVNVGTAPSKNSVSAEVRIR